MADSTFSLLRSGGTALLCIVLAVPLIRCKVKPNTIYGFRTAATLRDERIWYPVNKQAGLDLLYVGLALGLVALLTFFTDLSVLSSTIAWWVVLVIGMVYSVAHGLLLSRRLVARFERDDADE